jgi:O-Antigen ligase
MTAAQRPVQSLRVVGQSWLEHGLVAITGFLFGAVPEAGLVFGSLCGAWGVWRFREPLATRDLLIAAFAVARVVYALRSQGSVWVALLEALVMLLLPRAVWVLGSAFRRAFGFLILLGLCIPIGVALSRVLTPQTDFWSVSSALAREQVVGGVYRFSAVHPVNAWVLNILGVQGPGSVEYTFEARADRPTELTIFLLHSGLQGGRNKVSCHMGLVWKTCRIGAVLPSPASLIFGFGGYGLWKKGSSDIQVRSPQLRYLSARNPLEQFRFFSRQMGPSFNENAFGAWVVVMSLLALCALRDPRAILLVIIPMFVAVYLSGSRGAMFSGAFGLLTFLLARGRFSRLLLPVVGLGLIGVFFAQIYVDRGVSMPVLTATATAPGFRAFELDTTGKQSRLEIWQGAFKASLLEPMFGPLRLTPDAGDGPLRAHVFDALPHAHNLWIEMLIEGGLIQLTLAVGLFGVLLFRVVRWSQLAWLAVLVAILFINFWDFIFYYAPVRLCFGLFFGIGTYCEFMPQRRTAAMVRAS